MAKKAAPKAAQGKATTPPAAKAIRGQATPAPAAKAATGQATPAPAAKAATGRATPAPAAKATPAPAAKATPAPAAKAAPAPVATAPAAKAPTKATDTASGARPTPASKAVVYTALAETTGLGKKQVVAIFSALGALIAQELGKKGPGQFVLPGLLKLTVVRKPATKARSRTNPFTGAPMTIAAKPARNVVRALPLKALKEMV
ncbi:MAG: HU family DNA-binding protein [Planctomycetaceae bacterium]|nr:HU family DNA-binding protein [Planctomycetaceae bacterium]